MLIGAHMSIAGGVDKAIERGIALGCKAIQIFTKNTNQWKARPLRDAEILHFHKLRYRSNISIILAHDSYLINPASPDQTLRKKSTSALLEEMARCKALGISYLILHPGAHLGAGEARGIRYAIESLNYVLHKTRGWHMDIVLESTAGQGTNIGYKFEHLLAIIEGVKFNERIKVCLDTCHLFAAGYDISTSYGYEKTMEEFDRLIGLSRLVCIHVNDSKKELGSRVDRHEHIGKGHIGLEGFRCLIKDKRLHDIPKIIETPKGKGLEEDKRNMDILKGLASTSILDPC